MKDDQANEITVLLGLLDHNFDEVTGVRRLDQQLVYVPLATIAGAAYAALANREHLPGHLADGIPSFLIVVWIVVVGGLARNTWAHLDLLGRRRRYLAALPVHSERLDMNRWRFRILFWSGRAIYLALFTTGLYALWGALRTVLP